MTVAYVGIDPTAESLHIGHLVSVMMLKHFQIAGHKPIALVGGATGMIGDPSGKSEERNLLDEEALRHNEACLKKQLAKFLDFASEASNAAELVNNKSGAVLYYKKIVKITETVKTDREQLKHAKLYLSQNRDS